MLPLTPRSRSLGPEGVEPSSGPYKEPALTVELRADSNAPGRNRTRVLPVKSRLLCQHELQGQVGLRVCPRVSIGRSVSSRFLLSPQWCRMESNHRQRRIRSPCSRYNTAPLESGTRESNPLSRGPKPREAPFPLLPVNQSERSARLTTACCLHPPCSVGGSACFSSSPRWRITQAFPRSGQAARAGIEPASPP